MRFGKLSLLFVLAFAFPIVATSRAGVTLITHGFNADAKGWVDAMGAAIETYPSLILTNTTTYEVYFEQNTPGSYLPKQRKLRGSDPLQASSGEIILLLDWSQLAGTLSGVTYSTYDIAPSVASTLTATNFITELARPLAEQPLHLIGHSRGGSLICEVARLLGKQGIWVDHITTLDPHPLNNDYDDSFFTTVVDAPAVPYSNVLFADNYYQINTSFLGLDPSGQYVVGAYNRYLVNLDSGGYGGIAARHSNVHLWYHGTIDWRTPVSDGLDGATITGIERDRWWANAETNGVVSGFHYSLIGGGNRASFAIPAGGTNKISNGLNQFWDFGVGLNANRFVLDQNLGLWPNVLALNLIATNLPMLPNGRKWATLESGSLLSLQLTYQAGDFLSTNVTLKTFLDRDLNPYSGNEIPLELAPLEGTGTNVVNTVFLHPSVQAKAGMYTLGVEVTNGSRRRFLYLSELLQIEQRSVSVTIANVSGNSVQLSIAGGSGGTVVVEGSSDVVVWQPVHTNSQPGLVWNFLLPLRGESAQFYRARRL